MKKYYLLIIALCALIKNANGAARLRRQVNMEEDIQDMMDDTGRYHTFRPQYEHCPITSVVQREFPANAHHPEAVNLTVAMVAIIHYHHIERARDNDRPNIPRSIYNFLAEHTDREDLDEAGHLLAYSLGGPTDATYNFLPQSPCTNREVKKGYNYVGVRPNWYGIEEVIRDHLTANPTHYVRWYVQAFFEIPDSRRPTSFRLLVRYYDENHNHLSNYDDGPFEFINPPHSACSDRSDPWWLSRHVHSNAMRIPTTTTTHSPTPDYILPDLTPAGQVIHYLSLGLWPWGYSG